jgi:uncharacterized LabA/DUF88 family protein
MDLSEFKTRYFLFDPKDFDRIFAFVDFGNVRPWAKELWPEENKYRFCVEIDIAKMRELCSWVEARTCLFYYGFFARDERLAEEVKDARHNSSVFRIDKARKSGFRVVTKEVKLIPQYDEAGKFVGKFPKCNFDVEITMDLLTRIDEYDTVMLFSGDSDFGGLLKYLKSRGKKVVVVCTRNRMSIELEEVANKFIPAETLAGFLRYDRNNKNDTPPLRAEV